VPAPSNKQFFNEIRPSSVELNPKIGFNRPGQLFNRPQRCSLIVHIFKIKQS